MYSAGSLPIIKTLTKSTASWIETPSTNELVPNITSVIPIV